MAKKKVLIVGGGPLGYATMFKKHGWEIATSMKKADLIQFTGGEDVSPSFYNQKTHPKTASNLLRDKREALIFNKALRAKKPIAGICRGAQFLNVMCGGKLWQDVDGHANGKHPAQDLIDNRIINVTSTHHQMIIPEPVERDFVPILLAKVSKRKEKMRAVKSEDTNIMTIYGTNSSDFEALYYNKQRVLCFQPHPEFEGEDELATYYMSLINKFLL